jgi:hypothetical protein
VTLKFLALEGLHICGVSKTFGEWYQKTNKTEDTNKLTLLSFRIIIILHNTRTHNIAEQLSHVLRSIPKEAFADSFQKLYERCQPCVVKNDDYFEVK